MDGRRSEVALTVVTDYTPISDMNQGDPSLFDRIGRKEGISTLLGISTRMFDSID
jgi:hypothetical protein